jgi:regulator of replication initiation timing
MLCDIADKYLKPAQREFEKVKINYQRLLKGKELVDSQKIEEAKQGKIADNNELYAFLQTYKSVMRDYDNLDELIEEAFEICKTSLIQQKPKGTICPFRLKERRT